MEKRRKGGKEDDRAVNLLVLPIWMFCGQDLHDVCGSNFRSFMAVMRRIDDLLALWFVWII